MHLWTASMENRHSWGWAEGEGMENPRPLLLHLNQKLFPGRPPPAYRCGSSRPLPGGGSMIARTH